jgi:hypothetical protein
MWDMFTNSLLLFLKGKLFRDPMAVLKQWAIGFALAFALLLVPALLGLPLWLCVPLAALATGIAQPYLFKDLKYA